MTAEPDLPINDAVPAPTKIEPGNLFLWNWRQMQVYAQACVALAVAPLQAEIEALWAEVDEWKDVARCASEQQDSLFREARALSARADKLRAEVERLTFEMERLQQQYDERTACTIVHRGAALACSDAVRAAYSDEHHRAERLAEALQDAREFVAEMLSDERAKFAGYEAISDIARIEATLQKIDTALAQEARNG